MTRKDYLNGRKSRMANPRPAAAVAPLRETPNVNQVNKSALVENALNMAMRTLQAGNAKFTMADFLQGAAAFMAGTAAHNCRTPERRDQELGQVLVYTMRALSQNGLSMQRAVAVLDNLTQAEAEREARAGSIPAENKTTGGE